MISVMVLPVSVKESRVCGLSHLMRAKLQLCDAFLTSDGWHMSTWWFPPDTSFDTVGNSGSKEQKHMEPRVQQCNPQPSS